jgi:hypothetical protein
MAAHRLGPETKSAVSRAATGSIKGNIRVKEIGNIILREIKIPLKNFANEREGIEVFDGWTVRIVNDTAILPETDAADFFDPLSPGKFGHGIVKFFPRNKINRR